MQTYTYIGVGSNQDNPLERCREAIERLGRQPGITVAARSSFYETEPVGETAQDWFVNAVVHIHTDLYPAGLLAVLLQIERDMGRIRREKWGPRRIDLDLLFFGDCVMNDPGLHLPHPEIPRRRFVLAPLDEIAGDYTHPVLKKTVRELLAELPESPKVRRLPS